MLGGLRRSRWAAVNVGSFDDRFVNFNRRGDEVRMGGMPREPENTTISTGIEVWLRALASKLMRQWAMVREDAFSVVDYGAPRVNIGDRVHRGTGGGLRTVSGHSAL
jgi:hypothetical protein